MQPSSCSGSEFPLLSLPFLRKNWFLCFVVIDRDVIHDSLELTIYSIYSILAYNVCYLIGPLFRPNQHFTQFLVSFVLITVCSHRPTFLVYARVFGYSVLCAVGLCFIVLSIVLYNRVIYNIKSESLGESRDDQTVLWTTIFITIISVFLLSSRLIMRYFRDDFTIISYNLWALPKMCNGSSSFFSYSIRNNHVPTLSE